jgi:UDP-glucose 4-epimerase/UDP-glucuronate decarboxylase
MTESALLAGGAGFIGLHLANELLSRGWKVSIVDDFSRGAMDQDLQRAIDRGAVLVERDLGRPLDLAVERPDLVVHLAAILGVRNVSRSPAAVLRNNLLTLQNVLDWSVRVGAGAFVFSSTSEVADGAVASGLASVPVPEDVPFVCPDLSRPRASYAMSKAQGEMFVRALAGRHGLPAAIVRFFNVYGPRMGSAHVIPELIGRALADPAVLDVYGAEPTRAFCFVDDAVRGLLAVAELADRRAPVVNVGNDLEELEIGALARKVLELTGSKAEIVAHPAPAGSPRRRCPDIARLRGLTGYEPEVALEQGLRRTIEHYAGALI